jgi:hypothetical protein
MFYGWQGAGACPLVRAMERTMKWPRFWQARGWAVLASLGVLATACAARADLVIYRFGDLAIALQGTVKRNPGGTVTLRTQRYGNLVFKDDPDRIEIIKAKNAQQRFSAKFGAARGKKDAALMFEAAQWALDHGMIAQCVQAVEETLQLDPSHAEARRLKDVHDQISRPVTDYAQSEQLLRQFCAKPGMKIETSDHYILMHDLPPPKRGETRTSPKDRLQLLERVYAAFMFTFMARGVDLEIPQQKLPIVFFANYKDYMQFSIRQDAGLAMASGYWSPINNIGVFYDFETDDVVEAFKKEDKAIRDLFEQAKRQSLGGRSELKHLADTFATLTKLYRDNKNDEVLTHECTHQLAGNTGLFPRGVYIPKWVHEGLATYFETPSEGVWSGPGTVNPLRLRFYKELHAAGVASQIANVDFVVSDDLFMLGFRSGNHALILHAYAQAWAMTYFLMKSHPDKLIEYYRKLGEMPPDQELSAQELLELFDSVFGRERRAEMNDEWQFFMRSLKTEREELLDQV